MWCCLTFVCVYMLTCKALVINMKNTMLNISETSVCISWNYLNLQARNLVSIYAEIILQFKIIYVNINCIVIATECKSIILIKLIHYVFWNKIVVSRTRAWCGVYCGYASLIVSYSCDYVLWSLWSPWVRNMLRLLFGLFLNHLNRTRRVSNYCMWFHMP